jgi:hypothetical protein
MAIATNEPKSRRLSLGPLSFDWLSLDTWAVTAAVIFIVFVVAGIFPRVPW